MSNPTQNSSIEYPAWFDGKRINEGIFCTEFLRDYPMLSVNGTFFTVNGRVRDENRLKKVIYDRIKQYITSGVAKKVTNLLDVMRMECCTEDLPSQTDRIHVENGTLYLVLSILFSPTEPFFLFFNRDKDLGMPPRKKQPVYEQPVSEQDYTYETVEDTEYL